METCHTNNFNAHSHSDSLDESLLKKRTRVALLIFEFFLNLYHSMGKFSKQMISRWHWNIFFIFSRKQDLPFQSNCLHWRQFAWNVKTCFLEKKKIRKIFVICWTVYPECWVLMTCRPWGSFCDVSKRRWEYGQKFSKWEEMNWRGWEKNWMKAQKQKKILACSSYPTLLCVQ